jgi:hypothetical protein
MWLHNMSCKKVKRDLIYTHSHRVWARYLQYAKWDTAKAINMLINKENRYYKRNIVKIRGTERKYIEENNIEIHLLL